MEYTCPANAIQVMPATQQALHDSFIFTLRQNVEVKGKGEMDTYLLISKK